MFLETPKKKLMMTYIAKTPHILTAHNQRLDRHENQRHQHRGIARLTPSKGRRVTLETDGELSTLSDRCLVEIQG